MNTQKKRKEGRRELPGAWHSSRNRLLALLGCLVPFLPTPHCALPETARADIAAAIPAQALVPPRQPRRLLIYDANVGYGGHPSAAYATEAFRQMGERTGAFQVEAHQDPQIFGADSLRRFDAVFLNNTVGNLFTDPLLRQNLLEFVLNGGGLMGVHGTSVAFTRWPGAVEDWPEFGRMIGGRGANHRDSDERVFLKLDDPLHPLTAVFGGQGFEFRDEYFRVHEPYSRRRVRVLLSFDLDRTDPNVGQPRGDVVRADNDYAVAWIRSYGRGRTLYCTIAHNPYVFWNPTMLRFYLGAAQFVLGDLPAPTTPSARLTPAVRAQEQLGWRIAVETPSTADTTLPEAIRQATLLDALLWVGPASVLPNTPADGNDPLAAARLALDDAGLRWSALSGVRTDHAPQAFALARQLGVDVLLAEAPLADLPTLAELAQNARVPLAVRCDLGPDGAGPELFTRAASELTTGIGAFIDLDEWRQNARGTATGIRQLGPRLMAVASSAFGPEDAVWLRELRDLGLRPSLIVRSSDPEQARRSLETLATLSLQLQR